MRMFVTPRKTEVCDKDRLYKINISFFFTPPLFSLNKKLQKGGGCNFSGYTGYYTIPS